MINPFGQAFIEQEITKLSWRMTMTAGDRALKSIERKLENPYLTETQREALIKQQKRIKASIAERKAKND